MVFKIFSLVIHKIKGIEYIKKVLLKFNQNKISHEKYRIKSLSIYVKEQLNQTYQYLGQISFTLPEQYNARERKSINVSVIAQYLRFDFIGYQSSDIVSLTSLAIIGEEISAQQEQQNKQVVQLDSKTEQRLQMQKQYLQRFDQLVFEFNKELNQFIDNEDYVNADRYQRCTNEVKTLRKQYVDLQAKKLVCIQKQDFKMAQKIKIASEMILSIINKQDTLEIIQILLHENQDQIISTENQNQQNEDTREIRGDRKLQEELQASVTGSIGARNRDQINRRKSDSKPIRINSLSEIDLNSENIDFSNLRGNVFNFTAKDEEEYNKQLAKQAKKIQQEENEYRRQKQKSSKQIKQNSFSMIQMGENKFNGIEMNQWEQNNLIIENSKFDDQKFDFNKTMNKLADNWQNDDNKPPELKITGLQQELIYKLQGYNINDMILRLLISRDINHVREGIRFFDATLKTDKTKVNIVILAIRIVATSKNPALLYCCQYLILRCYQQLLQIETEKLNLQFNIGINFLDVKDQLYKQKDNVVILGKIQFKVQKGKQGNIQSQISQLNNGVSQQFIQQVSQLTNMLIPRCSIPQPGPKSLAINVLSTMASFPCFPSQQFFNKFINIKTLNEQFFVDDQKELKTNQKYYKKVESRAILVSNLLEKVPWILNPQVAKILVQFIDFTLQYSSKEQFRNALINIMTYIVQVKNYNGLKFVVKAINNAFQNKRILQQFYAVLQLQQDADNDQQYRIVILDQGGSLNKNQNTQQNICQFCLKKVFELDKVKSSEEAIKLMKLHIVLKCPCIGVCPACHQALETIYLPLHLLDSTDCNGLQKYKYKLAACDKCGMIMQQQKLQEHQKSCQKNLNNDQIMCNLCGQILNEGDQSLLHYSENKCKQCVRTNQNLKKLVQQKLQ